MCAYGLETWQEIPLASKKVLENGTSARHAGPIEFKDRAFFMMSAVI